MIRSSALLLLIISLLQLTLLSQQLDIIEINGVEAVKDELIVKFKKSLTKTTNNKISAERKFLLGQIEAVSVKTFRSGAEHWKLKSSNVEEVLKGLNQNEYIEYAEPNYILRADAVIPNDPLFDEQWGLHNTGQTGGLEDIDIDAPEAWEITTGDTNIVVGVIDSGIDYMHEDLKNNIWVNKDEIPDNGIDDDNNGYVDDYYGWDFINNDNDPMDDNGHGTHVAGIIGAEGNNGIGVSGVAWKCKMMALKFLGVNNSGPTSAAIEAIYYSIQMDVKLTNNSWGGNGFSEALKEAIEAADSAGAVFIAASGNDTENNDLMPHYPASYNNENIVSVAATDKNGNLSEFSNWGLSSVDLSAPGSEIYSTIPSGYGNKNGTSMAAPFVTGTALLIWSQNPSLSYSDIINQLCGSIRRNNNIFSKVKYGGDVNLQSSLSSNNRVEFISSKIEINFGAELINSGSSMKSFSIINNNDNDINVDTIKVGDQYSLAVGDNEFSNTLVNQIVNSRDSLEVKVRFEPQPNVKGFVQDELSIIQIRDGLPVERNIILAGFAVDKGTIINEETVSGNWNKDNSPYYLNNSIEIKNSLKIEPGSKVIFTNHHRITVSENATFVANGSLKDSIYFYPLDRETGWNGINILNSGNDDSLTFCYFEKSFKYGKGVLGNDIDNDGGALFVYLSSPLIKNCSFVDNYAALNGGAVEIKITHDKFVLDSCSFIGNKTGAEGGGAIEISNLWDVIVKNCNFENNTSLQGTLKISSDGFAENNQPPRIIVYNNKFKDNLTFAGGSAIQLILPYSTNFAIFKNLITGNNDNCQYLLGGAISIINCNRGFIYNNTITNNLGNPSNSILLADCGDIKIVNNILWNEKFDEILNLTVQNYPEVSNNIIFQGNYGNNNFYVDPLFADTDYYFLSSNSPGKDNGIEFDFFVGKDNHSYDIGYTGGNDLAVFNYKIDNGKVKIGETKIDSFTVYNLSDNTVFFDSVSGGSLSTPIDFEPTALAPYDFLTIKIRTEAKNYGISIDSLNIFSSGYIFEKFSVPIFINGIYGNILTDKVSGILKSDASPYLVPLTITIDQNSKLVVEAGTKIIFEKNASLEVDGILEVTGSNKNPVIFDSPADTIYWGGINFNTNANGKIENAIIDHYLKLNFYRSNSLLFSNTSFLNGKNLLDNVEMYNNIQISEAEVSFRNCIFSNNTAGSILFSSAAQTNVVNCLFINNTGYMFMNMGGELNIINTTLTNNNPLKFNNKEYYFFSKGYSLGLTKTNIVNSIFYEDKDFVFSFDNSFGANEMTFNSSIFRNGSPIFTSYGTYENNILGLESIIDKDPLFSDSLGRLSFDSPGIDKGNLDIDPSFISDLDLDGNHRIWNDNIDIGAYEYGSKPVSVADNSVPQEFSLSQNYPNPFNPTTTIKYQIPHQGRVELKIYNILGEEIKSLVNEIQKSGYYKVEWNGRNNQNQQVGSGVYIYRITSGEYIDSKKLILLK